MRRSCSGSYHYNQDVRGHNRSQQLVYDDMVNCLSSDTGRFAKLLADIDFDYKA